jgi:hypothetical protein
MAWGDIKIPFPVPSLSPIARY